MTDFATWLPEQRWYASKSQEISETQALDTLKLPGHGYDDDEVQLLGVVTTTGTRAIYQLIPELGAGLPEAMATGLEQSTEHGTFCFRHTTDDLSFSAPALRPMGAEQSNTTVVVDDRFAMKIFRKLEAGINPDLEMLRFLSHRDYPNIAPLRGWYEYEGPFLAATLGILQDYIPDGQDGWNLALAEISSQPDRFLERVHSLGAATAQLHTTLATDNEDPAFAPEEPSAESMALIRAKVDEDIEKLFLELPANDQLAPIAARGEDVRARLAQLPQITQAGRYIRIHGDYHLGQTLARPDGSWVLLDFEGEPARPLSERRMKRSPLRDVASMLRSFAYAVASVGMRDGAAGVPDGFEERARAAYLESYFHTVDPSLLPAGEPAVQNLLAIFELEKAIYELRYELDNRPDWVSIPVAGIERLLEAA